MKSRMGDYPTTLSKPIDSVAGRVVSAGEHFSVKLKPKPDLETFDVKPSTIPIPNVLRPLMGTRQNRMQIIGVLSYSPKRGYKLLGRCDCGKYEQRNPSTWRKMKAFDDCCRPCRQIEFLKTMHLTSDQRDKIIAEKKEQYQSRTK